MAHDQKTAGSIPASATFPNRIFIVMIKFEKEIIDFLGIPSIPKKEFDGRTSFDKGVAIVEINDGSLMYAVCSFNADKDSKPRIVKTFGLTPFVSVKNIYVVPSYMSTLDEVDAMDLDDKSKEFVKIVLTEAEDLENNGVEDIDTPENEYYFDHIHNDEEARAYIASYNKTNKIKRGRVPKTHDNIIMRLAAIYSEQKKNQRR